MGLPERDNRDLAIGALVNFSGVLGKGANVLFLIFLTRFYGLDVTGLYILVRAVFEILSKCAALGLDRSLLSSLSRHLESDSVDRAHSLLGAALLLGVCATVVVFLSVQAFLVLLPAAVFEDSVTRFSLRLFSLAILFTAITTICNAATRAKRKMHYEVIVKSGVEPLVLLLLTVVFYLLGMGFEGLGIAFVMSSLIGCILSMCFLSVFYDIEKIATRPPGYKALKRLFLYTCPVGLHDISNLLLQRIDLMLVGKFLSPSFLGLYGVTQEIASILKVPRQSFEPIFVPVIAASYQKQDRALMQRQYQSVSLWVTLITAGLFGFSLIAVKPIAGLFGDSLALPVEVLALLGMGLLINGTMGFGESILLIRRPGINLVNTSASILVILSLGLILVPYFGLLGAALSNVMMYFLLNVARVSEVYVLYKLQPFSLDHLKGLLVFTGSGFVIYIVQGLHQESIHWDMLMGAGFLGISMILLQLTGVIRWNRTLMHGG